MDEGLCEKCHRGRKKGRRLERRVSGEVAKNVDRKTADRNRKAGGANKYGKERGMRERWGIRLYRRGLYRVEKSAIRITGSVQWGENQELKT